MLELLASELQKASVLTGGQVRDAVAHLVDPDVSDEAKAAFLSALAVKGETASEIAAFARELRARAILPELGEELRREEILDVCGTGGDQLNTFNISTTVAIVVSAVGVRVAKHGNRAITSQSGSADVLEALGIPIDLSPPQAVDSLRERRFAFFFAQKYHPSFRHLGAARKLCAARKQRTIFNFLGPLLNPAQPSAQLVGVSRPDLCRPMAEVLQALGTRRAMVVSGRVGDAFLDEFSTLGETDVAEFYQDRGFNFSRLDAADFGLNRATLESLRGGDRAENARIIRAILAGDDRGPRRDAVLLNAGAGLFVAGRSRSLTDGIALAAQAIDGGAASAQLKTLAS